MQRFGPRVADESPQAQEPIPGQDESRRGESWRGEAQAFVEGFREGWRAAVDAGMQMDWKHVKIGGTD